MNTHNRATEELFFSKNDPYDIRLGDLVRSVSRDEVASGSTVISGYPDDEGISLNGGRSGAAEAPDQIRRFLYKMTPPQGTRAAAPILDVGNLITSVSLENRHKIARETASEFYKRGVFPISFGGGHDYGFPDAAAFSEYFLNNSQQRPMILNFDAHLDVRPSHKSFNSGTPFFRLLEEFSNKIQLIEIGLQPQCNSLHHIQWAKDQGAQLFFLNDILPNGLNSLLSNSVFKDLSSQTPIFISFDIDCLTSTEAPGCSQSWPTGLKLQDCLFFIRDLQRKFSVKGLGIYEVSPTLDVASQTAKAAALLTYQSIFQDVL